MHFEEWMENVVKAFEIAGVVMLAVGSIVALVARRDGLSARRTSRRRTKPHDKESAAPSSSAWKS